MVWFQCEDCGESLKKSKLPRHFSMCSATKLSCIDCGNIFGKDSVRWHNQCITEAEKYGPKGLSNITPTNPKENSKQELDLDMDVGLSNCLSWFCSLCNTKTNCERDFVAHVRGMKHRENAKGFDAKEQKQFEQPVVEMVHMDNSKQLPDLDVNVGLSNQYPWFCSLCNSKATSQHSLFSHAIGKKHRQNVKWFIAKQQQQQQQQSDRYTLDDKKDTTENGDPEQKKVGVAKKYSQADKKRKLETFDETRNREEAEEGGERKRKPKIVQKKQEHAKKGKKRQSESESDFEYEKEDLKLLLESYSKQELVNLIYKTAEKGSRLISAILDRDISQRNILVSGLGWETTQEYLKGAFEGYGEIEECSVAMDCDTGRSKGYGFVVFKTRKSAREALKNPVKRMCNRNVVCNLAKAHDMIEPLKIDLEKRHQQQQQQQSMDMFGQNMGFYGQPQPHGFDPMYGGAFRSNQMIAALPNYCVFGSGLMNPSNHVGMPGPYFGI